MKAEVACLTKNTRRRYKVIIQKISYKNPVFFVSARQDTMFSAFIYENCRNKTKLKQSEFIKNLPSCIMLQIACDFCIAA